MDVIGLDIGGANLKAAHQDGQCQTVPFPLWKQPEQLTAALTSLVAAFPPANLYAVTITGELADCFQTKAEGIDRILAAVEELAQGVPLVVWQTGGEFIQPELAREFPLLPAAANWHALATWLGRMAPNGPALLIDIGSTTTDIIPLLNGFPHPQGLTDRERLTAGELVYTGVERTPLCALAHSVPLGNQTMPLAAELFATTLDVYLFLGLVPEQPENCQTANGQPATRSAAATRLARMLCCDETEVTSAELEQLARFLADVQRQRIQGSIRKVWHTLREQTSAPLNDVLVSGSGCFLGREIAASLFPDARLTDLETLFDRHSATAACALAVARLAAENIRVLPGSE